MVNVIKCDIFVTMGSGYSTTIKDVSKLSIGTRTQYIRRGVLYLDDNGQLNSCSELACNTGYTCSGFPLLYDECMHIMNTVEYVTAVEKANNVKLDREGIIEIMRKNIESDLKREKYDNK